MKTTDNAVAAAKTALDDFVAHGPRMSTREAIARLAPSISAMAARGESFSIIARVIRQSGGIDIKPAYLRRLYMDAVRAEKKEGCNGR